MMKPIAAQTNHVPVLLFWMFMLVLVGVLLCGCVVQGGGYGHHMDGGYHMGYHGRY